MIKWGIIGLGNMGQKFASAIAETSNSDIAGVASLDKNKIENFKNKYKKLYSQLHCMIYLKAKSFSLLQKWRLKQEHKLWLKTRKKGNHKIMSKGDVINFMQTYQRITQNMFRYMPKYASIILTLNSNHQIKSAVYKRCLLYTSDAADE